MKLVGAFDRLEDRILPEESLHEGIELYPIPSSFSNSGIIKVIREEIKIPTIGNKIVAEIFVFIFLKILDDEASLGFYGKSGINNI